MEYGKEYGKVALGRYPLLDVAHTLEGALYLGYSRNETGYYKYGHRMAVHGDYVADTNDNG